MIDTVLYHNHVLAVTEEHGTVLVRALPHNVAIQSNIQTQPKTVENEHTITAWVNAQQLGWNIGPRPRPSISDRVDVPSQELAIALVRKVVESAHFVADEGMFFYEEDMLPSRCLSYRFDTEGQEDMGLNPAGFDIMLRSPQLIYSFFCEMTPQTSAWQNASDPVTHFAVQYLFAHEPQFADMVRAVPAWAQAEKARQRHLAQRLNLAVCPTCDPLGRIHPATMTCPAA